MNDEKKDRKDYNTEENKSNGETKQKNDSSMTRDQALAAFAQALKFYLLDQFGKSLKPENRKKLEDFDPMTVVVMIPLMMTRYNITAPEDLDNPSVYAPLREQILIYVPEVTFTDHQEKLVRRYVQKLIQYS